MTLRLSKREIVEIVSGASVTNDTTSLKQVASGVEFDSRQIRGGELFVAMTGSQSDGHLYLKSAFESGAALALVSDAEAARSSGFPESCILVGDTLRGFQQLATNWRERFSYPVIAITGSVGKTTTKEFTAALLSALGPGAYSKKSFNNHVGVPYSLCKLSDAHKWAVLEIGMNHAGEIQKLTSIAKPSIGVITVIGPAHIENLGSIEAIADAKCEMVSAIPDGATLVINGDDPYLKGGLERANPRPSLKMQQFSTTGTEHGAHALYLDQIKGHGVDGISFQAHAGEEAAQIKVNVLGVHNCVNIAAAILAARVAFPAYSLERIATAASRFTAPLMRLMRVPLSDGRVIIDDSYNANPSSMGAAIEIAGELKGCNLSVGLMLGDMLELGEFSQSYHAQLVEKVNQLKPTFLVGVGPAMQGALKSHLSSAVKGLVADNPEDAARQVVREKFDVLLVKASRGIGLDRAVKVLQELVNQKL